MRDVSRQLHKEYGNRKAHHLTIPSNGKNGEKQELSFMTSGIDITTWEGNLEYSKICSNV